MYACTVVFYLTFGKQVGPGYPVENVHSRFAKVRSASLPFMLPSPLLPGSRLVVRAVVQS